MNFRNFHTVISRCFAQCGNCRNSFSHVFHKKFRESNGFTYLRNYLRVDLTKFLFSEREFLVFPHCALFSWNQSNENVNFTEIVSNDRSIVREYFVFSIAWNLVFFPWIHYTITILNDCWSLFQSLDCFIEDVLVWRKVCEQYLVLDTNLATTTTHSQHQMLMIWKWNIYSLEIIFSKWVFAPGHQNFLASRISR